MGFSWRGCVGGHYLDCGHSNRRPDPGRRKAQRQGSTPPASASSVESTEGRDFIRYPTDHLFGIIDEPDQAGSAIVALRSAGIDDDSVSTFHGDAGAIRIDASGSSHGLFARLIRISQAMSMDGDQSQRYEDEARNGHTVIAVHIDDDDVRDQALGILKTHHGHYINYYRRLHSENLVP